MLLTVSGFGVAGSPPPPELHLERASQPPHEELGASPPAAEDLGLSRHFRLEKTGVIVDLRGDEHRLVDAGGVACGDRKSTRLNSSHGYISHTVFCLKKK